MNRLTYKVLGLALNHLFYRSLRASAPSCSHTTQGSNSIHTGIALGVEGGGLFLPKNSKLWKIVDHSCNTGTCQKEELIETSLASMDWNGFRRARSLHLGKPWQRHASHFFCLSRAPTERMLSHACGRCLRAHMVDGCSNTMKSDVRGR